MTPPLSRKIRTEAFDKNLSAQSPNLTDFSQDLLTKISAASGRVADLYSQAISTPLLAHKAFAIPALFQSPKDKKIAEENAKLMEAIQWFREDEIDNPRGKEALLALLSKDSQASTCIVILDTLGFLADVDPKIALAFCKIAQESPHPKVRHDALSYLSLPRENAIFPEVIATLIDRMLHDPQEDIRESAHFYLRALPLDDVHAGLFRESLIVAFQGETQPEARTALIPWIAPYRDGEVKAILLNTLKEDASDAVKLAALQVLQETFESPWPKKIWQEIFTEAQGPKLKQAAIACVTGSYESSDWEKLTEILKESADPEIASTAARQLMELNPKEGAPLLAQSYDRYLSEAKTIGNHPYLDGIALALIAHGENFHLSIYNNFFERTANDYHHDHILLPLPAQKQAREEKMAWALLGLILTEDKTAQQSAADFLAKLSDPQQTLLLGLVIKNFPEDLKSLKSLCRFIGESLLGDNPLPWLHALPVEDAVSQNKKQEIYRLLIPELGTLLIFPPESKGTAVQEKTLDLLGVLLNSGNATLEKGAAWQLQRALGNAGLSPNLKDTIRYGLKNFHAARYFPNELRTLLTRLQDPKMTPALRRTLLRNTFSQEAIDPYQLTFEVQDDKGRSKFIADPGELEHQDTETLSQYFYLYQSLKDQWEYTRPLMEKIMAVRPKSMSRAHDHKIPIILKADYPATEHQDLSHKNEIRSVSAYYSLASHTIFIRRTKDLEYLFFDSLNHESGHLLMQSLYGSRFPRTKGRNHDWPHKDILDMITSPSSAWSEGFADFTEILLTPPQLKNIQGTFVPASKTTDWSLTRNLNTRLSNEFVVASILYSITAMKKTDGRFIIPETLEKEITPEMLTRFDALCETMQHRGKQLRTHKDLQDLLKDFVHRYPQYEAQVMAVLTAYEMEDIFRT